MLSAADVNSSLLRCLLAMMHAVELAASDVNFSLRCPLADAHCMGPFPLLGACSACRRVWNETMPWNYTAEGGVVVTSRCDDDVWTKAGWLIFAKRC